ncbi:MAG: hypothetical protein GF317_11155, partial [Candidatus Lokiarchaeota archaeon]|nr:hypothetical protein [Candidatus Lokiarchaeota archaeon]MBD3200206.1 hypothetical protein [Candidatus Lokiarchaeota archaeon]
MVKRFYKINEKSKVLGLLVFILFFGLSMPLINKSHEYEKSAIINDELDHKDLRPSLYEKWNDTYSFAGTEKGLNVEMDDEGNVYVAGPVDHPSELYNFGVNKYNSAGELLWNRSYDGFGSTDWCDDLAVDTVNNVFYLVGYSYTGSSWNMTLVQYTTDGVYQWNRTWASSSGQGSFGKRVAVNSSGYVFISGETGDYEFTIACFNFYGQRIRNRTVFFNTEFQLTDMVIDEESNLYLTGYNYTNYYPLINKYNTFIGKYNKNLNEEWVRFYTDDYYNITKSQGIALDSTNYVYVCDLLGENYSSSGQYWHLIKYDTNGNYILNKTLFRSLTNEDNHPADIVVDSINDFIYLVGRVNGTNYSEDVDVIVVKCDGDGNYLFNWTWDGGDWDYGHGLYYNPEGELIVCGERDSDLRQETSNQDFDMLVIKYPLKPENFTLNLNRYEPGTYDENGIIELNWNESLPYDINNYTVYNSTEAITEINESLNIHKEGYIGTNLLVEGLTDGTYYYLVQAFNEYGNSTSNYIQVKVKLLPKNFTLTSNATSPETDGVFTLFWEESIAANNYTIYNSTSHIDEINSSVSIVDFGITDLNYTVNNNYDGSMYYAVGARNDVGDTLSNNILVDIQIIPGPLSLTSNATNPDQDGNFTLSWTESEKADNYTLYTHNNYITHINESLTTILDQTNDLELFFSINTSGSYYYIVQAFNENGNSTSNCLKVTLELPPEAPILTSNATDPDQDGNFTLFWSNTFRADNYTIYNYTTPITSINDSLGIVAKEISELNYTITNWIEGNHYFVVVANNSFGMTMSNCINIWVLFPPESFVLDTNATSPDIDGFFGLNWSESIGANTYSVYQSQNYINEIGTGVEIIFSSLTNRETNLFNISGDYYFVVIAFNEAGNSTSNNIFVSIQIPPDTFSLTSHDAIEPELDGVYSLNWTESQYADNYSLYWSYSEITDIGAPDVQLLYNGTNLSYTFEELLGNEDDIYYFKVVSTNEFGSEESNSYNITVGYPGVIPEQFVLSSDDATEPELDGLYNLNWTQSQYADNYSLCWSYHEITEINGSVQLLYNGTNLSYTFEELLGNEDDVYYFKVYAYNQ